MARKHRTKLSASAVVLILVIAALGYYWRHDLLRAFERSTLPEPVEYPLAAIASPQRALLPKSGTRTESTPTFSPPYQGGDSRGGTGASGELPSEINLAVPFTPQAPHANWSLPYKEFCEEASVLMAASYINKQKIPTPEFADAEMLKIRDFEVKRFGYYEDTTAEETAAIIREYYQYDRVKVLVNPTVENIKQAVAGGQLVIMPAAGRLLGNPYFTPPGPLYHMLVIKGYTKDGRFIVNDPGTRRGADFTYTPETLMNAMHDWRADGVIELGRKAVIIVG